MCYHPSAWVCAAVKRPYFPDESCQQLRQLPYTRRISQYETRSSRYRSQTEVRSLAPSLQNLTGKPSLTYSIGPFVVELFTAERLTRSPKGSNSGAVRRRTAAPHASRVARTRSAEAHQAQNPTDGIWFARAVGSCTPHPLCERRSLGVQNLRCFRTASPSTRP